MSTGGDRVRTTPPGGVAEGLAELVPALLDRVEEMTDRMVGILVQTEPAYREVMAAGDLQLRASLRRNLEAGIRGLLPDVPATHHARPADGAPARAPPRRPRGAAPRALDPGPPPPPPPTPRGAPVPSAASAPRRASRWRRCCAPTA